MNEDFSYKTKYEKALIALVEEVMEHAEEIESLKSKYKFVLNLYIEETMSENSAEEKEEMLEWFNKILNVK